MLRCHSRTYLCFAEPRHGLHQVGNSSAGVWQSIEEAPARFKETARHVDVASCEVVEASPEAPEEHNGRGDSELRQFSNVASRLEASIEVLILFELCLPMKLLLQISHQRRCHIRPYTIHSSCQPRVERQQIEAVPGHQEESFRQTLPGVLVGSVVGRKFFTKFINLLPAIALRQLLLKENDKSVPRSVLVVYGRREREGSVRSTNGCFRAVAVQSRSHLPLRPIHRPHPCRRV